MFATMWLRKSLNSFEAAFVKKKCINKSLDSPNKVYEVKLIIDKVKSRLDVNTKTCM